MFCNYNGNCRKKLSWNSDIVPDGFHLCGCFPGIGFLADNSEVFWFEFLHLEQIV